MNHQPHRKTFIASVFGMSVLTASGVRAQNPIPYCMTSEMKQVPHMYSAPIYRAYMITHFPNHPEFDYPSPVSAYMNFCTLADCDKFRLKNWKEVHQSNGAWAEFVCR
jgi:hypothetical protein